MRSEAPTGVLRTWLRHAWKNVRLPTAIASFGLSYWCVLLDPVVNNDGIRYLNMARLVRDGAWAEAKALYHWPYYAAAVGWTSWGTGLDVEPAAWLLNALFFALLGFGFVWALKELGADRRALAIGAVVFLFFATVNECRSYVTRDAGYLAFYTLGVAAFLGYARRPRWSLAFLWAACIALGALFRVEGVIILFLLPATLLASPGLARRERLRRTFRAAVVPILLCVVLGILALALERFRFEPWIRLRLFADALATLPQRAESLTPGLLSGPSEGYGLVIVVGTLALIVVGELFLALTPLHVGVGLYALWRRALFPLPIGLRVWASLLAIHALILVVYVVPQFFLTERYTLPFVLTALLGVPFGVARLYDGWRQGPRWSLRRQWGFYLVVALLAVGAVDGLVSFGGSKMHLREAGLWIREQTSANNITPSTANATPAATVFSNNSIVRFYAGIEQGKEARDLDWEATLAELRRGVWRERAYTAIRLRRRQSHAALIEEIIGQPPDQVFRDRRGDQVLVFRRAP